MLHTVNKSPFEKNSLTTCLRLSKPGSTILLIEDGVYGALKGCQFAADVSAALADRKVFALAADLKARGISADKLIDNVEITDYHGFVRLASNAAKVQSWL